PLLRFKTTPFIELQKNPPAIARCGRRRERHRLAQSPRIGRTPRLSPACIGIAGSRARCEEHSDEGENATSFHRIVLQQWSCLTRRAQAVARARRFHNRTLPPRISA